MSVIDILPQCVSAVYFFYNPEYSFASLGNYSAIREIAYARHLSLSDPNCIYYYLGYYIHNCPKMAYKAKYKPCELLDPTTFEWVDSSIAIPLIDEANEHRVLSFSDKLGIKDRLDLKRLNVLITQDTANDQEVLKQKRRDVFELLS